MISMIYVFNLYSKNLSRVNQYFNIVQVLLHFARQVLITKVTEVTYKDNNMIFKSSMNILIRTHTEKLNDITIPFSMGHINSRFFPIFFNSYHLIISFDTEGRCKDFELQTLYANHLPVLFGQFLTMLQYYIFIPLTEVLCNHHPLTTHTNMNVLPNIER